MKRVFRKIHLWLSVPFGIVITLICFSGAMLVFEKEITECVNPGLYRVEHPSGQPLPVGEVAARVAATLPVGVEVTGVTVFQEANRTWQVSLSKPRKASVYVDPYTGEIKGPAERLPFFRTMFSLHRWLLGSRPSDGGIFWGKIIVGVSTLLFIVVLLTGIVLWWPRTKKTLRNSLKIVFRHGWLRFWHGLHVAGGMYALLLLLVMALTGLTWSFGWYRTGFYALFGVEMQARSGYANTCTNNWQPRIQVIDKLQSMPTKRLPCLLQPLAIREARTVTILILPGRLLALLFTMTSLLPVRYVAGYILCMSVRGAEY